MATETLSPNIAKIHLTERAALKIRTLLEKDGVSPEEGGLRVGVQGGEGSLIDDISLMVEEHEGELVGLSYCTAAKHVDQHCGAMFRRLHAQLIW